MNLDTHPTTQKTMILIGKPVTYNLTSLVFIARIVGYKSGRKLRVFASQGVDNAPFSPSEGVSQLDVGGVMIKKLSALHDHGHGHDRLCLLDTSHLVQLLG